MKKTIIVILLSVLAYSSASSQSYLGLRGSFDITSLSTGSARSRPGFSVGAIYSTRINDEWYFQPSALYSYTSVRSVSKYKPAYSSYTYSLEVPLMLSRRFGDDEISFGVDFGPFLKYGLHGKCWADDPTTRERTRPNIFEHQKRFDVGPQIGFSVIVYKLYMGYAFQYGLIKPWDDKKGNNYSSNITFGYLFELP